MNKKIITDYKEQNYKPVLYECYVHNINHSKIFKTIERGCYNQKRNLQFEYIGSVDVPYFPANYYKNYSVDERVR